LGDVALINVQGKYLSWVEKMRKEANCFEKNTAIRTVLSLGIDEIIVTEISRRTNISYAYCNNIVNSLQKKGILVSGKDGRVRKVKLTKNGVQLYKLLLQVDKLMGVRNDDDRK
jgi:predicted transcriptional regulator